MHPKYGVNADIAMLELMRPAILNDRVALPCFPRKGQYPPAGKKCTIAGKQNN